MTTWASAWAFFLLIPLGLVLAWMWYARRQRTATMQFSQIRGFLKVQRGARALVLVTHGY